MTEEEKKFERKKWCMNVVGNMLATIIGIVLTFGVSNYISQQNDKKLARKMMFHVIKTAEDGVQGMKDIDSIYQVQEKAIMRLWYFYFKNDGDLSKVPEDTLAAYCKLAVRSADYTYIHDQVSSYFYSAQMMHQFDNPERYTQFSAFVQYDDDVYEKLGANRQQSLAAKRKIRSKLLMENFRYTKVVKELLEDETLPLLLKTLETSYLKTNIKAYQDDFQKLLKETGATQEEYEAYKKENFIKEDDKVMSSE